MNKLFIVVFKEHPNDAMEMSEEIYADCFYSAMKSVERRYPNCFIVRQG